MLGQASSCQSLCRFQRNCAYDKGTGSQVKTTIMSEQLFTCQSNFFAPLVLILSGRCQSSNLVSFLTLTLQGNCQSRNLCCFPAINSIGQWLEHEFCLFEELKSGVFVCYSNNAGQVFEVANDSFSTTLLSTLPLQANILCN